MNLDAQDELIALFSEHITDHKKKIIENALNFRTRHITIVLEDILKSQNASATLRTCDCLGIQDVHIIENFNNFKINPKVTQGSSKWVDLYHHNHQETNNTIETIKKLKREDYWIIATLPDSASYTPYTIPLRNKIALLFGNEETGLSKPAKELSDASLRLPMFGFTRSYNISVSVSMILFTLVMRLQKSSIPWQLNKTEKKEVTINWLRKIIPHSDNIEKSLILERSRVKGGEINN